MWASQGNPTAALGEGDPLLVSRGRCGELRADGTLLPEISAPKRLLVFLGVPSYVLDEIEIACKCREKHGGLGRPTATAKSLNSMDHGSNLGKRCDLDMFSGPWTMADYSVNHAVHLVHLPF